MMRVVATSAAEDLLVVVCWPITCGRKVHSALTAETAAAEAFVDFTNFKAFADYLIGFDRLLY